ncbi:hypothetical protein LTR78_004722 [Recurvomyces mirabilis]|uniref:Uncharacterized protein n=1 Tax=Recurvomyces mirabilis TaxID=574656 RepID=A0AAE1C218_9PEZI|nr:hypothetical protein LTR78_004722 [Recurvomyces mirabilis]KAK5157894.1 hypothetical protein LTS14_003816 [Recurvomyces mirabilis]
MSMEKQPWTVNGWRENRYQLDAARSNTTAPIPLSAPTAINPAFQSSILVQNYNHRDEAWRPDGTKEQISTDAHATAARPILVSERHSPAPGGNYGPPQLNFASPQQPASGPWRGLHDDLRRNNDTTQVINAPPLTIQIPPAPGAHRSSPPLAQVKSELPTYPQDVQTPSIQAPSLPSFASFQKHTTRTDDADVDGPEIAPMAARLPCNTCTQLGPMVRNVAIAVAELDENVQMYCNKAVTRSLDMPTDGSVRTVQWVLDRLRYAKGDMVEAGRRVHAPAYFFPHPPAPSTVPSRLDSPPRMLKRSAMWEKDEYSNVKRPRSGGSPGMADSVMYDHRRASVDFSGRSAYSPQAIESAPLSAYPRQGSPGRLFRPLPSPSSLAYPQSAAASLPPPTVHPGSPTMSYQASTSIHTATTDSATSAHIANLQHQVTLKSLSLQSLQSEYSTLLQKLQREKLKSQTIEKKTTVSEQEVNDLTGKNEDLSEQVVSLQSQLEESERKRDNERVETGKEKEQWSRMLDMSNRLQAKLAGERQGLAEERDHLRRVIQHLEQQTSSRTDHGPNSAVSADGLPSFTSVNGSKTKSGYNGNANSDADGLRREVMSMRERVATLTEALQKVQSRSQELDDHTRRIQETRFELTKTLRSVLGNDVVDETSPSQPLPRTSVSEPTPKLGAIIPATPIVIEQPSQVTSYHNALTSNLPPLSAPRSATKASALPTPTSATGPSIAEMISAARATSPNAEELGIYVQPSTSSPEDLVRALGPVPAPAPLPAFRFEAGYQHQSQSHAPIPADKQTHSPPSHQQPYGHASPYRPLPPASQYQQWGHQKSSPPSSHTSPGSSGPGGSSPRDASLAQSQPQSAPIHAGSYSQPQPLSADSRRNSLRGFPDMAVTSPAHGPAGFRQWEQPAGPTSMPPPPRPMTIADSRTVGF